MTQEMTQDVAVVTGGTRGIGKAIAQRLHAEGYQVFACGRSAPSQGVTVDGIRYYGVDVRHSHTFRPVLRHAREAGRLTVLVNAAGIVKPTSIAEMAMGDVMEQFNVNVIGAISVTREFLEVVDREGVHRPLVGIIASTSGQRPSPGWAAYGASKAALINFGLSLAAENPWLNVITLSPGRTATALRRSLAPLEDQSTIQQPEDVADYLASLMAEANAQPLRSFEGSPLNCARTTEAARA